MIFYNRIENIKLWKIYFISLCISGFLPILIAYLEGNLYLGKYAFWGKFIVWPIMLIVIFPILNILVLQFYQKIKIAIENLMETKIIQGNPIEHPKIKKELDFIKSKKKFSIQILFLSLVFSFYVMRLATMSATWAKGDYYGFSILAMTVLVIYFIEALVLLNFIVDIVIWQKIERYVIYEKEFNFSPKLFHPDNAVGLSVIGDVAFKIYQSAFLFLIAFSIQIIEKYIAHPTWDMLEIVLKYKAIPFTLLILIFVLPISFFVPLLPFHKKLKFFKDKYKKKLNNFLNKKLSLVEASFFTKIENKALSEAQNDFLELQKIKKIYTAIDNIPSWPYDKTTITSFIYSIILPLFFVSMEIIFG